MVLVVAKHTTVPIAIHKIHYLTRLKIVHLSVLMVLTKVVNNLLV